MSNAPYNPISICIDMDSLHKRTNITGEIWLEVAGFEFPEKHWNDFPVIILGWWLDSIHLLWSGGAKSGTCLFMDGSYAYVISKENDAFILRCYSQTFPMKGIEWEGLVNLTSLLQQVLNAASTILKECGKRGWKTTDTEGLESKWVYINSMMNPQSA